PTRPPPPPPPLPLSPSPDGMSLAAARTDRSRIHAPPLCAGAPLCPLAGRRPGTEADHVPPRAGGVFFGEGGRTMSMVSQWAEETFGEAAKALTEAVPACLARAHERARDGHQGVHTQTLEAYGHGLYAVQYEELATGL